MAEKPGDGTPGTPTEERSLKCHQSTPTFQTPHRPSKRAPLREIPAQVREEEAPVRRLSFATAGPPAQGTWSEVELKALVEFVFHSTGERWPIHKQEAFGRQLVNLCGIGPSHPMS